MSSDDSIYKAAKETAKTQNDNYQLSSFRKTRLCKVLAYILIFAFIIYDITWAQGGEPLSFGAKTSAVKVNGRVYEEGIKIPRDAGWMHESHINGSDEFIFNIQDPHASLDAQHSIGRILE